MIASALWGAAVSLIWISRRLRTGSVNRKERTAATVPHCQHLFHCVMGVKPGLVVIYNWTRGLFVIVSSSISHVEQRCLVFQLREVFVFAFRCYRKGFFSSLIFYSGSFWRGGEEEWLRKVGISLSPSNIFYAEKDFSKSCSDFCFVRTPKNSGHCNFSATFSSFENFYECSTASLTFALCIRCRCSWHFQGYDQFVVIFFFIVALNRFENNSMRYSFTLRNYKYI
jgi:hypothetical protein